MSETEVIETMQRTDFILCDLINKRNNCEKEIRERISILSNDNLETLEKYISDIFGVTPDVLSCKSRKGKFIFARHAYRYFLERATPEGKLTDKRRHNIFFKTRGHRNLGYEFRYTLYEIRDLVNCDHTSIIWSVKVVKNLYETDRRFRDKIELIKNKIENNKIKFPEI